MEHNIGKRTKTQSARFNQPWFGELHFRFFVVMVVVVSPIQARTLVELNLLYLFVSYTNVVLPTATTYVLNSAVSLVYRTDIGGGSR